MSGEISKYLQPAVLARMDHEFRLFVQHEKQRIFHRQLLLRSRPRIAAQHDGRRDRQEHQRWPPGAIEFFARQAVLK